MTIPKLVPVTAQAVKLDDAAWGLDNGNEDPREQFWGDAHQLLSNLRWVIEADGKLGLLKGSTRRTLKVALIMLEYEFEDPNVDDNKPF